MFASAIPEIVANPMNIMMGAYKNNSRWGWVDGSSWEYQNWAKREPSGDGPCTEFYVNDGRWNDRKCNDYRGIACSYYAGFLVF